MFAEPSPTRPPLLPWGRRPPRRPTGRTRRDLFPPRPRYPRTGLILALTGALILCLTAAGRAQLRLGQYEDEAPLRSWNLFGPDTAAVTGLGGPQAARALDLSVSQTNPALLTRFAGISVDLSGSFHRTELYRYGPVNTGVLISEGNTGISSTNLDFAGIGFSARGWGLAFTVSINEILDRPTAGADVSFGDQTLYTYVFAQDGFIRTYNLGVSRRIGDRLAVGIGFNHESGSQSRDSVERYIFEGVTIEEARVLDVSGTFFNAGLTFDLFSSLTVAAVFRSPYTRKAEGAGQVRNQTPPAVDIRIEAEGESRFRRPLVLGVGADYRVGGALRVAADARYLNWAAYEVEYFGEPQIREFKNVVTLSAGAEYVFSFRVFGQDFQFPLRLGAAYDPQPVLSRDSAYRHLTGGFGLRHRHLRLDAGGAIGWEAGSGADLKVYRAAVTLGFQY
jgi:hypothetical protein